MNHIGVCVPRWLYVYSIGNSSKPGDSVLCYNLEDANINDDNFDKLNKERVPDLIVVKKFYTDTKERKGSRIWKLKHLSEDITAFDRGRKDYNEFLDDLEEDPQLRQNVNIFKDASKLIPVDVYDGIDPSVPRITLEEMLDDLVLEDDAMGEDI